MTNVIIFCGILRSFSPEDLIYHFPDFRRLFLALSLEYLESFINIRMFNSSEEGSGVIRRCLR